MASWLVLVTGASELRSDLPECYYRHKSAVNWKPRTRKTKGGPPANFERLPRLTKWMVFMTQIWDVRQTGLP